MATLQRPQFPNISVDLFTLLTHTDTGTRMCVQTSLSALLSVARYQAGGACQLPRSLCEPGRICRPRRADVVPELRDVAADIADAVAA